MNHPTIVLSHIAAQFEMLVPMFYGEVKFRFASESEAKFAPEFGVGDHGPQQLNLQFFQRDTLSSILCTCLGVLTLSPQSFPLCVENRLQVLTVRQYTFSHLPTAISTHMAVDALS